MELGPIKKLEFLAKILNQRNNFFVSKDMITDPITEIINNNDEIKKIMENASDGIFLFLYSNQHKIFDILYESDAVIDLNDLKDKITELSDLYFLDLLLIDKDIIYFIYPFEFITNINKVQKNCDKVYRKIFLSKIMIDIINNFNNNSDNELNEEQKKEIQIIEEENQNIIKKNFNSFKEISKLEDVDSFNEKNIDEIYADIICNLIYGNFLTNDPKINDILEQLDIKNIEITRPILNKLDEIFKSSNKFINKFKVSNIIELIKNKDYINFYYFLFAYILKHPYYIYQFEFLNQIRNNLINKLKQNTKELTYYGYGEYKDKIDYIVSFFLDSEHYTYYFNTNIKPKLKLIITINIIKYFFEKGYYQISLNENRDLEFVFYLNDGNEEKKMSISHEINLLSERDFTNDESKKLIRTFNKIYEKIPKLYRHFKNQIKYISNNKSIIFNFKIVNENINKTEDFYNIDCLIELKENELGNDNQKIISSYRIKNFIKEDILRTQGFLYLTQDLENMKASESLDYADYSFSSSSFNYSKNIRNKNKFYNFKKIKKYLNNDDINDYQIITLEKIIGKHKDEAESIEEISNNTFISIGSNNELFYFCNNFEKQIKFKTNKNFRTNLFCYNASNIDPVNERKDESEIILCSDAGVEFLSFKNNNPENFKIEQKRNDCSILIFKEKDESYLLVTQKCLRLLCPLNQEQKSFYLKLVGGIQIGDNNAVFTSNSIVYNGQNKIYFYNSESKDITDFDIKGDYSFTLSNHSMILMPDTKGEKNILLCGCIKYKKEQSNGILLFNLDTGFEEFYDTDNFEVYCFCPISIIIDKNISVNNKNLKKSSSYSTNYFFVGGFDTDIKEGAIKLFKLNRISGNDDNNIKSLEFIQDIAFPDIKLEYIFKYTNNPEKENLNGSIDFEGFSRNISCITQCKETGKILITCWDGYIYLASKPNIFYYLKKDFEEKNFYLDEKIK